MRVGSHVGKLSSRLSGYIEAWHHLTTRVGVQFVRPTNITHALHHAVIAHFQVVHAPQCGGNNDTVDADADDVISGNGDDDAACT